MPFELDNLDAYDDESIANEMQRVAKLVGDRPLTRNLFDTHSKVASSTIVRRFGGWRHALERAGIASRYSGRTVSQRMRSQATKRLTDDELLEELRRVADRAPDGVVTRTLFDAQAACHSDAIERRFGSWGEGLAKAGLQRSRLGRRYSVEDYFENLLNVWTHHGRQPLLREMDEHPSQITAGGYEAKFGGWRRALREFVDRMNQGDKDADTLLPDSGTEGTAADKGNQRHLVRTIAKTPTRAGALGLSIRYKVLRRDSFRCVLCGRSPASTQGLELHVDHIVARARGGDNSSANLRTLCSECNLGKGVQHETPSS